MQNKAFSKGGRNLCAALHCEFMRQALGSSSAVQSAVLITSDVSHCLGLCVLEEGRERLEALASWAPTRMGGFGAVYRRWTSPWYIAVGSQNLYRIVSVAAAWFPALFNTETHHATSPLCWETRQSQSVEKRGDAAIPQPPSSPYISSQLPSGF